MGEYHGGRDFEALLDGGLWVRTPEGRWCRRCWLTRLRGCGRWWWICW
ncbi:hypothetical protein [Rappaport israeli]|nr:hypothetical protein [Rappaport israeli]